MAIKRIFPALLMALFVVMGLTFGSAFAQETEPPALDIVVGEVTVIYDGLLLVLADGVEVAIVTDRLAEMPILAVGDIIVATGVFEGEVFVAATLELFEAPPEETPEPTPEVTLEPTPEVTPEPVAGCDREGHPVATAIAEVYDVAYEDVIALHCAGNGFGNIVRAYALAEAAGDGTTAQDFIDRHNGGEGWGQIMQDSEVHPSDLAPGRILRGPRGGAAEPTAEVSGDAATTDASGGPGNGNGGGHGNGNGNGNGGGNGNGNGNGRGGRP
jgi:uncharacterized membrane protein YgcG